MLNCIIRTVEKRIAAGEDPDEVVAWGERQIQKSGDESGATEFAQQMLAAREVG